MSSRATRALNGAKYVAEKLGSEEVGTEHLLYALTDDKGSVAMQILVTAGINIDNLQRQIYELMVPNQQSGNQQKAKQVSFDDILHDFLNFAMGGVISQRDFEQAADDNAQPNGKNPQNNGFDAQQGQQGQQGFGGRRNGGGFGIKQKDDDEINQFGEFLNDKAKAGKLDPVIGRGKEIERIIQILCRRTKNNPILIGEPGVGKTAIVDGLAQAIENGEVPDILRNKKIFSLDVASLVAGTRYRGDFEERFKNTLKSIQKDGNTILFIDEIHTILSAGSSEGGLDIANIIKPLLARGELQTIGATTIDEYRKYFEKDAALERRFQPIMVDQPTVSDTIEILQGLKEKYENHHKVEITDEAISAAAILSDRYITDRFLPDKAIDLIDEAASKKTIFNFTVPQEIRDLEDKIKQVELDKNEASRHEQ
ncbi:MAG: ATP-dependent Clp protease ATP-binding subunit, partial [Clostridia bacterium]|nr:ATP-dependent Clp protease ATP-binding subunit [Clostridia bacterium]